MKTNLIIYRRGAGYVMDSNDHKGALKLGVRIGLTPEDAALYAARIMMRLALDNPEGGSLMAPPEVLELVPKHLREIAPQG